MTLAVPEIKQLAAASMSLGKAFWERVRAYPDEVLVTYASRPDPTGTRAWTEDSYLSAAPKVARLAHFLRSIGVEVGTPVAIISQTRLEWILVDLAIQTVGAITVSVYPSQLAAEAGFVLFDSGARVVLVENEEQLAKINWLRSNDCPIPATENNPEFSARVSIDTIISFERINDVPDVRCLAEVWNDLSLSTDPPPLPLNIDRDSVASYVYTSGTTGAPKGVVQTHGNHLANVEQAAKSGIFPGDGTLFLYLPLAHSFARLVHYVGCLTSTRLVLPAVADIRTSRIDLSSIARDLRESIATVVPSVPRLFEKMAAAIQARSAGKGLKQRLLRLCLFNAQSTYERRASGKPLRLLEHLLFEGLQPIRIKVRREMFGKHFTHAISGGAKLDPGINRFFDALEITICEGYGLTETCVATHVNRPMRRKIGSVGPSFDGVETKISPEDGEVMLKGPNVTRGYLNRPKATAESWDAEGWFHTGDIGALDQDGFLFITDRKKELVITAGGKKIPPTAVEGQFKRFSFISHALLFGEGRPYCVMLFTLNEPELRSILANSGIPLALDRELSELSAVRGMVQDAVNKVNETLATYESIKAFCIADEDFSVENGLLTPTLKMRRRQITARHFSLLSSLY